jgi:hypothetical protein
MRSTFAPALMRAESRSHPKVQKVAVAGVHVADVGANRQLDRPVGQFLGRAGPADPAAVPATGVFGED